MTTFNAESTTTDVIQGISLAGKRAVVTGASSGLGLETATILAGAGARVLMLARDAQKLEAAVTTVKEAHPDADITTGMLDLADLDSVRRAAEEILDGGKPVDLLIDNAGVMVCPLSRTAQGFEMQFGTNHLGHFLFTCLLVPALKRSAPARVVVLSSAAHKIAPANLTDPNYEQRDYDKWQAYGESKSANMLFALALDKRLAADGIRVLAVHPGMIMTELGRHMQPEDFESMAANAPEGQQFNFKTIPQGAATTVWAATSPDLEGKGGIYLEDCQIAEPAVAGGDGGVESYVLNEADAETLWTLSEELVGQSFAF